MFGSTGSGFGSNTQQQSGGSLFGNTSGGFGSGSGFGSSSASPFGQNKTGFGTTTSGGGLFGSTTSTSGGFGGFGGSSSAFGSGTGTSGGGVFGQSKPAFGGTSGGSLFGGGGGSSGFGPSSTTPAFGGGLGSTPQNNGTGSVPFQATEEKDPSTATNAKSQYQTITIQDPYKPWSFEELRLVDYAQGRKHGNASNQPGAFGAGSGFGGFGQSSTGTSAFGGPSTTGGMFGQQSSSSSFGQQTGTASGFGGSGSNLFGSKPQTSSLFGSTPATSAQSGTGLFGTSGGGFGSGTSGGFGSGGTGSNLFGQSQQQNKPSFGGFGSGTTGGFGSSTGGGFGTSTTSSGGGLFGSTTATSLPFGQQQQGTGTSFGGFGQRSQQQQGQTGSNLFGSFGSNQQSQQQKPSLFGGTTSSTSTGLFGGQQQPQQSSGSNLFGGSTSNLFNKPASSNLFGGSGTGETGLFGSNQQQQPSTGGSLGGLFGQSTQQPASNLFGSKPTAGSSIFGQGITQQQPSGGGLFGGSQQQQPQSSFGSMFGASQAQPQQQQQAQQLNASQIQFPYGAPSLFLDVQSPTQSPGPIATPLSTSQKAKKQAIIPAYRINPNASSRLITPQKRPQGYGFSYSTYGTPGSAFGSPIGMGSSLLGSSIGRSLGKSYSSSNLRNSYKAEESLLLPGALSGSTRSTGSMKKLNINRNLNTRRSLFESDVSDDYTGHSGLRKQVSFDSGTKQINGTSSKETGLNPLNGALVRAQSPESVTPTLSSSRLNGRPEMEHVNGTTGKELAVIAEDGSPPLPAATKTTMTEIEKAQYTHKDPKPGAYWMSPDLSELRKMSKSQLARVKDFRVGRQGVGEIRFGDVDLSQVPLEKIIGDIVVLDVRRATVYGDDTSIPKPSVGTALNVPSEIMLENSWPRASGGRLPVFEKTGDRFSKHIKRLKRVEGTEFVHYDDKSGRWTFKVPHYTTYGLDYDDDDEESALSTSVLSEAAPPTPMPLKATASAAANKRQQTRPVDSIMSPPESSPDDTFEFKKGKRKHVPGQFDEHEADLLRDEPMAEAEENVATPQSFLGDHSVGSSAAEEDDLAMAVLPQTEELEPEMDREMAGTFPTLASTTEQDDAAFNKSTRSPSKLKSILKARDVEDMPLRAARLDVDNWAEQLRRTISPVKRDRQALKAMQTTLFTDHDQSPFALPASVYGTGFATSIDLMNSIFGKSAAKRTGEGVTVGKELRSGKRLRTNEESEDAEIAFHQSVKPRFGANGVLVYVAPGGSRRTEDRLLTIFKSAIVAEHQDVRFAHFTTPSDLIPPTILLQQESSQLGFDAQQVPFTITLDVFKFSEFAEAVPLTTPARKYEQHIWGLAGILFDDAQLSEHDRLAKLKEYWARLCKKDAEQQLAQAATAEEKAFIYLASGDVVEACAALLEGGDFRLATLVAQFPGNEGFRRLMQGQLKSWRELNTLSEFNDAIRAMYEVLAGNVCMSKGIANTTAENRIPEMRFSQRFKLSWRQAFGLHLFYGIELGDGIEDAVRSYMGAIQDGNETALPRPWFTEQRLDTGWNDPNPEQREDVIWGLLKLHVAFTRDKEFASLSAVLEPENVSGNPIDARLSFQLFHLLRAQQEDSYDTADAIINTYAASLEQVASESHEALKTAVWVLTHLTDREERINNITRLLQLNAARLNPLHEPLALNAPPGSEVRLLVPREWECAAKALYARAVEEDPISEARWLISAGDFAEAHNVVCKVIGPSAIIEEDYDQLREVLASLNDDPRRKKQVPETAWDCGGGLYHSYIELLDFETMNAQHRTKKNGDLEALVQRIAKVLAGIKREDGLNAMELKQRVAMQFMGAHVIEVRELADIHIVAGYRWRICNDEKANCCLQLNEKATVFSLPLTEDLRWKLMKQHGQECFRLGISV